MWSSYFFQDCSHLKTMKDKVSYFIVLVYHFQVLAAFTVFWDLRTKSNGCHREEDLLEWVQSLLLAISQVVGVVAGLYSKIQRAVYRLTSLQSLERTGGLVSEISSTNWIVRTAIPRWGSSPVSSDEQRGCLERNHEEPAVLQDKNHHDMLCSEGRLSRGLQGFKAGK